MDGPRPLVCPWILLWQHVNLNGMLVKKTQLHKPMLVEILMAWPPRWKLPFFLPWQAHAPLFSSENIPSETLIHIFIIEHAAHIIPFWWAVFFVQATLTTFRWECFWGTKHMGSPMQNLCNFDGETLFSFQRNPRWLWFWYFIL